MNWLKRNPVTTWKWYHRLAYHFLFFAFCFMLLFVQHLIFGYPKHMETVAFGVATTFICIALADWAGRHIGRTRR